MGTTKDERVRGHYNISSSIMDVDLLSSSDESSFDDADIMDDVTQPHASEAKDDKEDEKTELSTNSLTDSSLISLLLVFFFIQEISSIQQQVQTLQLLRMLPVCGHTAGKGQSLVWLT